MKKLALAIALVLAASPALAISRYNSMSMSCQSARAAIHNEGAIILRWTSARGFPIYDRYIRNSRYCDAHEYAEWRNIPTRDDPTCPVLYCEDIDNRKGLFFIPDNYL